MFCTNQKSGFDLNHDLTQGSSLQRIQLQGIEGFVAARIEKNSMKHKQKSVLEIIRPLEIHFQIDRQTDRQADRQTDT